MGGPGRCDSMIPGKELAEARNTCGHVSRCRPDTHNPCDTRSAPRCWSETHNAPRRRPLTSDALPQRPARSCRSTLPCTRLSRSPAHSALAQLSPLLPGSPPSSLLPSVVPRPRPNPPTPRPPTTSPSACKPRWPPKASKHWTWNLRAAASSLQCEGWGARATRTSH